MPSKQNLKRIDEWQKKNMDQILLKVHKRKRLPERIQLALDKGCSKSRQSYIIEAVLKRLEEDGIPELEDEA